MSTQGGKLSDVSVGDDLPPLPIPITTSLVVGGALASRDFTPVHHDRAAAQAAGLQDVFMNILTTNGLVGRYVTDWAGPDHVTGTVRVALPR
jgi:acyl dehydratase